MINNLLGEDHWPELESVLNDFVNRHDLSHDYFVSVSADSDVSSLVNWIVDMLISDRPRQYVFSGFRNYSVNELVDLINESESNPFPYFRARFFFHKLISLNDKFGKEPLGKEMNAFLSKSKEMTIHQIFLESKK